MTLQVKLGELLLSESDGSLDSSSGDIASSHPEQITPTFEHSNASNYSSLASRLGQSLNPSQMEAFDRMRTVNNNAPAVANAKKSATPLSQLNYTEKYRARRELAACKKVAQPKVALPKRTITHQPKLDVKSPSHKVCKEEPHGPMRGLEDLSPVPVRGLEDAPSDLFVSRSVSSLASSSLTRYSITPECSVTRTEAKEMIEKVQESIHSASEKLGSSHEVVERARKELKRLKSVERQTRHEEILNYHTALVDAAIQSRDLDAVEGCVHAAGLALGLGHDLVVRGRREVERMYKEKARDSWLTLEAQAVEALREAYGDMCALQGRICEAAAVIGAAHPAVEAARAEFLRLRELTQKDSFERLLSRFGADCEAARTVEELEEAISRAQRDGLGKGNQAILAARRDLEAAARKRLHEERALHQNAVAAELAEAMECRHVTAALAHAERVGGAAGLDALEVALATRELQVLLTAARLGQTAVGAHHESVRAARARYRDLTSAVHLAGRRCMEQEHESRVLAAAAAGDMNALDSALKVAAASPLGPAHAIVVQGKKELANMRKEALSRARDETLTEAERDLTVKLVMTDHLVNQLSQEAQDPFRRPGSRLSGRNA